MNIRRYILIINTLALVFSLSAAKKNPYQEYIETYSEMAIEQQRAYGIPASITLAQGLLESRAGQSSLATLGNNHFGIKCHNTWTGDTLLRDDDESQECFRAYGSPEESYLDHSRFLCRGRYRPLHEIPVTDYAAWARGLKSCGYATDPNYAERLIAIIERYNLYLLDTDGDAGTADFILSHLKNTHTIRRNGGLHYVIANPGDTYSSIAAEFSVPVEKLLTFNEMERDGTVDDWEEVYLQEKHDSAPREIKKVTMGEEDTLRKVAQRLGMKISAIRRLNPHSDFTPGSKLKLR